MSDIKRALLYVEAIQREIDAWRSEQANKGKGGQSVGRTAHQFLPSTVTMLEWHLREIRASLADQESAGRVIPDPAWDSICAGCGGTRRQHWGHAMCSMFKPKPATQEESCGGVGEDGLCGVHEPGDPTCVNAFRKVP
jgi:hypothetical protein